MSRDLPKQVQAQLEAAEALEKTLEAPVAELERDPAEAPQQPAQEASAEPAPAPAAQEPPKPDDVWEQRYKSLKGMYDRQNEEARQRENRLQSQVDTLTHQIADLAKVKAPAAEATSPVAITDKDIETFGPELTNFVKRASDAAVAQARSEWQVKERALEDTIASLKNDQKSMGERQAVDSRARYFAELKVQLPDLDQINADERFLDWCREVDPVVGKPRQVLLDDAFNTFDVARTVAYFQRYKASVAPAPQPEPEPAPKPKRDLSRQVTPTTSKVEGAQPADETKIWTSAEVNQFYDDLRRGRLSKTEAAAIEAQIDRAAASGRVR